jgi:hypothetical protein
MERAAKTYLAHYIYCAGKSVWYKSRAGTTTQFYTSKIYSFYWRWIASRAKHGWSALENTFTWLKFNATVGNALIELLPPPRFQSTHPKFYVHFIHLFLWSGVELEV